MLPNSQGVHLTILHVPPTTKLITVGCLSKADGVVTRKLNLHGTNLDASFATLVYEK